MYFPGSPILRVEGTFAECVLLETVILSILNHDSAIAAAASRMATAAGGRPLIEMGARRTHELAAVAAVPRRVRRRLRDHLRPGGRVPLRHPDRRHQRPRLHPAARQRARRLHRAGRSRSGAAPRCWSTPTTWPRRSVPRSRSPGPNWARSASTPGTCCWSPTGCAQQLDDAGRDRDEDRRHLATWTSTPSPRWRPRRWTRTASAPSW